MFRKYWQLIGSVGIAIALVGCNRQQTAGTPSPDQSPTSVPAPKEVRMTEFRQINGTPYLYAPIYVGTEDRKSIAKQLKEVGSASSYDGRQDDDGIDIRNYLFVHRDNLSASKLLSNNSARLLELEEIGEPAPPSRSVPAPSRIDAIKKVKILWYVKVAADTNGDKILNDRDRKQIAISDVSGANYRELIRDIDRIILVHSKGLERRLVIYASGNKHFVADVDLIKRQTTVKDLPALN
jgi:hypothetical protein